MTAQRPNHRKATVTLDTLLFHAMVVFHLFSKVWLVPFADLPVQHLATKQNAQFTEGARKLWSSSNPFVYQSSWNVETV